MKRKQAFKQNRIIIYLLFRIIQQPYAYTLIIICYLCIVSLQNGKHNCKYAKEADTY